MSLPFSCVQTNNRKFGMDLRITSIPSPHILVLVGVALLVAQVPWLMGAGLKRDLIFDFTKWGVTWRLIGITMPRSTAAITLIVIRRAILTP